MHAANHLLNNRCTLLPYQIETVSITVAAVSGPPLPFSPDQGQRTEICQCGGEGDEGRGEGAEP